MSIFAFIMHSLYIENEKLQEFGFKPGPGPDVEKNVIPAPTPAIISNPVGYYLQYIIIARCHP